MWRNSSFLPKSALLRKHLNLVLCFTKELNSFTEFTWESALLYLYKYIFIYFGVPDPCEIWNLVDLQKAWTFTRCNIPLFNSFTRRRKLITQIDHCQPLMFIFGTVLFFRVNPSYLPWSSLISLIPISRLLWWSVSVKFDSPWFSIFIGFCPWSCRFWIN